MEAIDTNILVRIATRGDEVQLRKVENLMREKFSSAHPAWVSIVVLAELAWVLTRCYGYQRPEVGVFLRLLIKAYEGKNIVIDSPTPIEAIRFRMEQAGLTQKDLVPFIGTKSRVSEVLAGKRPLTLAMARKLHKGLGIPAEILLEGAFSCAAA